MIKKRTKIVATISDKRCEKEFIRELYDEGMDVIRINSAHLDTEGALRIIKNAREVSDKIAVLLDTKGPEIRIEGQITPALVVHTGPGLIGIVELPSLPERPAYRRMQRRGQPLDHVAGFMNLAALDGCVATEGATDDLAQRFGAIDDEQPADLGI